MHTYSGRVLRSTPTRVLGLLLLAVVLAGCGGANPGAGAASDAAGGPGFPVRLTGKFGTTTVPAKPVRVVAMSWTDADLALSLGVAPVGIARAPDTPHGLQPWTASALGQARPELFDTLNGDPLEQIAALRPDLILATKDYHLAQSYRQLSQIAPVVTYLQGPNSDSWQQVVTQAAAAFGDPAKGQRVISGVEQRLAGQRAAHPELNGRTFSYLIQPTPAGAYTVSANADVSAQVLGAFGMRLTPTVLGLPPSGIPNRSQLSVENLGLLDADIVIAAGSPDQLAGLAANPVFTGLSAVRRGAYLPLDYTTASALAFPSSLSLDWAATQVVPRLAQAAHNSP
jgi:ABC-type Fe3+-hydroxamate transport system substrate-binding protein